MGYMEDDGSIIPGLPSKEERIKRNLSKGEEVLFLLDWTWNLLDKVFLFILFKTETEKDLFIFLAYMNQKKLFAKMYTLHEICCGNGDRVTSYKVEIAFVL